MRGFVVMLMGGEGEDSGEAQAFMMGERPLERSLADLPAKMEAPPMSAATAAPPPDAVTLILTLTLSLTLSLRLRLTVALSLSLSLSLSLGQSLALGLTLSLTRTPGRRQRRPECARDPQGRYPNPP